MYRLKEPPFVPQFEPAEDAERRVANRADEDLDAPEWNWCSSCGLRMILFASGRPAPPLRELYDAAWKADVFRRAESGRVLGAFHRELASFARDGLGFARARAARNWTPDDVANQVQGEDPQYVLASVSQQIRDHSGPPPDRRNGHFVLVYGVERTLSGRAFVLHDPAGFASTNTQRAVRVPEKRFAECFSGNVVVIDGASWRGAIGRGPDGSDHPDPSA